MATPRIPGPMERRHLIEKSMDAAQSLSIARTYLDAGRASDAIVFLSKADARDELEALAGSAVEQGDAFLLKAVEDELEQAPNPERWLELAAKADALGKESYGEMARRQARSLDE